MGCKGLPFHFDDVGIDLVPKAGIVAVLIAALGASDDHVHVVVDVPPGTVITVIAVDLGVGDGLLCGCHSF